MQRSVGRRRYTTASPPVPLSEIVTLAGRSVGGCGTTVDGGSSRARPAIPADGEHDVVQRLSPGVLDREREDDRLTGRDRHARELTVDGRADGHRPGCCRQMPVRRIRPGPGWSPGWSRARCQRLRLERRCTDFPLGPRENVDLRPRTARSIGDGGAFHDQWSQDESTAERGCGLSGAMSSPRIDTGASMHLRFRSAGRAASGRRRSPRASADRATARSRCHRPAAARQGASLPATAGRRRRGPG